MKKLLYVDHAYHNKTKSTQFLQDIFTKEYDVTKFDFDPYNDSFEKFKELNGSSYDTVILFQIMPPIKLLKKHISYKHIAFFPMYDATNNLDDPLWFEYRDCNIINFSRTLHDNCIKYGFSSYYIQYFPEPIEIKNWGDENSVFFWQRTRIINLDIIEKILNPNNINKLYLHSVPDPEQNLIPPSKKWEEKIEYSNWFDSKQELLDYIQKSALYIAPREYEGFGNSYLDAMACGRCVIALNNPAMNEYITHGETGLLYTLNKLEELDLKKIRIIQKNTLKYIKQGRNIWLCRKSEILKWISNEVRIDKAKLYCKYFLQLKIIKQIFSVTNHSNNKHKVITILGIKVKLKKRQKHE